VLGQHHVGLVPETGIPCPQHGRGPAQLVIIAYESGPAERGMPA
jgi:hypothetical protein